MELSFVKRNSFVPLFEITLGLYLVAHGCTFHIKKEQEYKLLYFMFLSNLFYSLGIELHNDAIWELGSCCSIYEKTRYIGFNEEPLNVCFVLSLGRVQNAGYQTIFPEDITVFTASVHSVFTVPVLRACI
jgi:hypothetical protein